MKDELTAIGKALDDKTDLPWWKVDEYIALLRGCHSRLLKMKPKQSCQNCKFFDLNKCDKAGAVPPDAIKAKGCEMFQDVIGDLMG
jgi:hypothetical protein